MKLLEDEGLIYNQVTYQISDSINSYTHELRRKIRFVPKAITTDILNKAYNPVTSQIRIRVRRLVRDSLIN
jgi:hypothetical protein